LEEPGADEHPIIMAVGETPEMIVANILEQLR